jgi:type I restriction enzyme M protein
MLGAMIGDIAGSRFEWHNYKGKDFEFFSPDCQFTDDTVMTAAVADALMACNGDYGNLSARAVTSMRDIGQKYPNCGYGGRFNHWMFANNPHPYDSYGNGAAMRVSAAGFVASSLEEAKDLSFRVTSVTHNHPEGIKGAEATAVCIYMARHGASIPEIRAYIAGNYYPLDKTCDQIRPAYTFDVSCQGTVPQAITAFLESVSFEDAIRTAVSLGGDSDTLAAITGGIAEAYYGIPQEMKEQALAYLDKRLQGIVSAFYSMTGGQMPGAEIRKARGDVI